MRLAFLGLVALAFAAAPQAQQNRPSLRSTYVVPSMPGEAVRVTTYARRPPQQGRLSRRYRGLRANRSPQQHARIASGGRVAERTYSTPRHTFVKRGGSYFQVVPRTAPQR